MKAPQAMRWGAFFFTPLWGVVSKVFLRKLLYAGQAFNLREGQENMFRRLSSKGAVAFAGVTLLSAVLLTGCGGDSEDSAAANFCNDFSTIDADIDANQADDSNLDAFVDKMKNANPPGDIGGDWQVLTDRLSVYADKVRDLNPQDEADLDALLEAADVLLTQDVTVSRQAVADYVSSNC